MTEEYFMLHVPQEVHTFIILGYVLIYVFVYKILWIRFRDVQLKRKPKKSYNYASLAYNNSNHSGKISPVEKYEIQNFGTKPSTNTKISPISR